MKKLIFNLSSCLLFLIAFTSCELFGLELQKDYKYVSTPPNNQFNMTAYEFIEKRQNIDMRLYLEAINFCGMREEFEKQDRTYVIFADQAFASYLEINKIYEIKNADKLKLSNLLRQYIGLKSYGTVELPSYALEVKSLYEKAPLYIGLLSTSETQVNPYQVVLNSYPGSKLVSWVTSTNIKVNNGYIYILTDKMPLVVP